jgi:hypothetical protein
MPIGCRCIASLGGDSRPPGCNCRPRHHAPVSLRKSASATEVAQLERPRAEVARSSSTALAIVPSPRERVDGRAAAFGDLLACRRATRAPRAARQLLDETRAREDQRRLFGTTAGPDGGDAAGRGDEDQRSALRRCRRPAPEQAGMRAGRGVDMGPGVLRASAGAAFAGSRGTGPACRRRGLGAGSGAEGARRASRRRPPAGVGLRCRWLRTGGRRSRDRPASRPCPSR